VSPSAIRWLIGAILLVLWEVLPRAGLVPQLFLPPLSQVVTVGIADWRIFVEALAVTLSEAAVALVFACGGGILAGALVGSVARLRGLLLPVVSSLYAVPLVVLYPVFTAWFGIGAQSKIAFASIYGFFPTLLGTAAGIQTIDAQLLVTARSMGANLMQRMRHVVLPAAIPTVIASLRLGGALVIVGVVVSEMLTSSAGIGYLITSYRTVLDSPRVYVGILLVLLLGVLLDLVMRLLEHAATRHRPSAMPRRAAPAV
jgi:NitT/TauT family transport system permease protein